MFCGGRAGCDRRSAWRSFVHFNSVSVKPAAAQIEARQAVHDKAVDEYNAGTEAAPDTADPADAPAPDAPGSEKE
jgi:hypothetical protein